MRVSLSQPTGLLAVLANWRRTRGENRENGEKLLPGGFFRGANVKTQDGRKEKPERGKDGSSKAVSRRNQKG
jgi:hypothetical protein